MPSWPVHVTVAKDVFGIGEVVAEKINRVIDVRDVHDLGRKMPKEPTFSEKFFDLEAASKRVLRLTKAQAMVRSILLRDEHANAFFLHHTLDLLAPRLIAANITNTPIERCADNVCEAVCMELELVSRKVPYKLSNFSQAFKSMLNQVISHPSLASWVNEASDRRLTLERSVNIQDHLTHHAQQILRKLGDQAAASEVVRSKYIAWAYGYLMTLVSRFATRYSHLIDYALLTPFTWEIISERFIRTTKKKAAGLGRDILRICEYAESMEEMHSRIIRAIDFYTENWLRRYGVEPPQSCKAKYADLFISGYKIVENFGMEA